MKAIIEGKKEGQITKDYDLPVMVDGTGEMSNFSGDLQLILNLRDT